MHRYLPWAFILACFAFALIPNYLEWKLDPAYWGALWASIGSLGTMAITAWRDHIDKELALTASREEASRTERLEYTKRLVAAYDATVVFSDEYGPVNVATGLHKAIRAYHGAVLRVGAYGGKGVQDAAIALANFLEAAARTPSSDAGSWCKIDAEELHKKQIALSGAVHDEVVRR